MNVYIYIYNISVSLSLYIYIYINVYLYVSEGVAASHHRPPADVHPGQDGQAGQ